MIVREREHEFVLIEQHHHGMVSGEMAKRWKEELFLGKEWRKSVEYAIEYHDYGWDCFDKQALWNREKKRPYTFADYPYSAKLFLYRDGIDKIEENDLYAALLCSVHFSQFVMQDQAENAKSFVKHERERQERILRILSDIDETAFQFHYRLLKFADNLSLYFCLNEPSVPKDEEHFFFKDGIMNPNGRNGEAVQVEWINEYTLSLSTFPFIDSFTVVFLQKRIEKQDIQHNGLKKCYDNTVYEKIEFRIISK